MTKEKASGPAPRRTGLRIVAHLVAEVPVVVIAVLQIAHGWLPTSDDAVIAWRTWGVFGGPVPLDGQFTQITAAGGHAAFDLGPLQYFLLALPERLDPLHGLSWGAALLVGVLLALAIEAMWSAAGPWAGAATALVGALMTESLVQSTVNLSWNPSIGVYAFFATVVISVAIAVRGKIGWAPVAVATASLAAQCHMSFVAPTAAALVLGLVGGLVPVRHQVAADESEPTRPRYRHVVIVSAIVAVACWIAPLVQQLGGHPGNWTVLSTSLGQHGRDIGAGAALRGMATVTSVPPAWWVKVPVTSTVASFQVFVGHLYRHPPIQGLAMLLGCVAIALGALATRRRGLAVLALIASFSGAAAAWTLASVPQSQAAYLYYYLYFVLWPVGIAVLASYALACGEIGTAVWRRLAPWRAEWFARLARPAASVAVALAGAGLLVLDIPLGTSPLFLMGWQPISEVAAAVPEAQHVLAEHGHRPGSPGPITVTSAPDIGMFQMGVDDAVAYVLVTRGYAARVSGVDDLPLGAAYRAPAGSPRILISLAPPGSKQPVQVTWVHGRP